MPFPVAPALLPLRTIRGLGALTLSVVLVASPDLAPASIAAQQGSTCADFATQEEAQAAGLVCDHLPVTDFGMLVGSAKKQWVAPAPVKKVAPVRVPPCVLVANGRATVAINCGVPDVSVDIAPLVGFPSSSDGGTGGGTVSVPSSAPQPANTVDEFLAAGATIVDGRARTGPQEALADRGGKHKHRDHKKNRHQNKNKNRNNNRN